MSDGLKSFGFIAVLGIVCSLLLAGASAGLKDYQSLNVKADRRKNILKSVRLIQEEKGYTDEQINRMFETYIEKMTLDPSGDIIQPDRKNDAMTMYLYKKDDCVEAYIIPINTKGLWGPIHGYLALDNDGSTIEGFTVYKHSETPGLGGEIEQNWFQKNFVGKRITNEAGDFVSVKVAKGEVEERIPKEEQEHFVDGISGATLTGKLLSRGLKNILLEYEPVSVKFRTRESCSTISKVPWGD